MQRSFALRAGLGNFIFLFEMAWHRCKLFIFNDRYFSGIAGGARKRGRNSIFLLAPLLAAIDLTLSIVLAYGQFWEMAVMSGLLG